MKRTTVVLLGAIAMAAMSSPARSESPVSPWEMAVATEQWLVEGAGARFPDGMADPASDGDFVFVDGSWPLPFRERVGEAVALRISPDTGCYEFADPDGTVFWTVVPVAPLTWNWISPFRSPLRPDARDLYSPFRIAREWLLLSPAEFDSRAESAENAEPLVTRHSSLVTRGAAGPATNLCFTAFSYTETNLFFAAAWPTNETLPEAVLDLYGSTNLLDPRWTFLSSHPATTNPVSFAVAPAALPWYVEPTQHVHDATCAVATNVVLSPLDGVTVYTNVVWSCTTNRTPVPPGFFQLGTHHDTDGDGLFDSFEKLASGTDPASSDTDGDGVPDGLTWAQWRSHPLWAENGDGTNLVVFLYEPVTNGFAALRFGDLCIPLASNAGPWCLCVPTNAVVDCTLVSGADTVAMLWYGPPEAVEWTPVNRSSPGPRWTWDVPDDVAVPIWCDRPMSVFGGNVGGGSCRFARPELRIRSEEPGQEGCLDVCVHGSEGIARFSWSVEPSACTGLWAFATGHLSDSGDGRSFCIDVSNAVPGSSGARTGMLFAESIRSPFFGDDVLFGTLSGTVSAHRCEGLPDPAFGYCLSCGVVHDAPASAGACYHEPGCATKTNLFEDCDCAPPFVRIGGTAALRIVGDFLSCCHAHDFYPSHAELLSAPDGLRASLSNGLFLGVAPEARSPTIGGFVADCRIWDWNGAPYRDQAVRFTCADLRVEPCLSDAQVPYEWEEAGPDAYYLQDGTFYVARRADPYPVRLWNESPSDARLVFAFASPTNGPGLFDPSLGTRHSSLVTTNAAPFAALNDDRTVYLDALCSNVLATLSLTLSDPIADRTFLSESLAVKVVDTAVGEHWRVRSATDAISWDFSDAPEDVYAYLWRPNADSIFGDLVGFKLGKTPSLSLDLPPGDYLLDFYFPRVYDGGSWAAWSTNYLHIRPVPEFARDVVGVQCRTDRRVEVALTNGTFHSDVHWTLSPVVANGPRLFATSNSVSGATSMTGCSNVWVSAGTVPGVYSVTASYPGFTNATATVIDLLSNLNGDFFRNGIPTDNELESLPVVFTNGVGVLLLCNNNHDGMTTTPDCENETIDSMADYLDLTRFSLDGTGLFSAPQGVILSARLEIECTTVVSTNERPDLPVARVFSSSGVFLGNVSRNGPSTIPLPNGYCFGNGHDLYVEAVLHGIRLEMRLVFSVNGVDCADDCVSSLSFPFLLTSNLDITEKLFASFADQDFHDALEAFVPDVLATNQIATQYVQDYAEIGLSESFFPGWNPRFVFVDFWNGFYGSEIEDSDGHYVLIREKGFDGGNVESSPPSSLHPNGCIIVGNTLSSKTRDFLERQEVQTNGGELFTLPVEWCCVGHVDEVLSVVPAANGIPYYLVGDLELAISILQNSSEEVLSGYELPSKQAILSAYGSETGMVKRAIISGKLDEICGRLQVGLGVPSSRILRVPVLYRPIDSALLGTRKVATFLPNSLNLIVVRTQGECRLVVPKPFFEPFEDYYADLLVALGHDEDYIGFVPTLTLHERGGEAHCGSNSQRIRENIHGLFQETPQP